jgi:uncharacterized membrane protein YwzB
MWFKKVAYVAVTFININSLFYHMLGKRGIAPLLATVLLIVLAVGLGVVVMNFGRAQIEIAAQCSVDIGLDSVELNGKEQVCFDRDNNRLFFIVENGAQIDIESLRLRVIGEQAILAQDVDSSFIAKENSLLKYVGYDTSKYGEARQIRLTPRVTLYDEVITCKEQSVEFEEIRDCEK